MSPELKAALERLRDYKMTPAEKFEQRVSFVYGQQDWSSGRTKSKDEIRQMLIDVDGAPECQRCKELEAELARVREALAKANAFLARIEQIKGDEGKVVVTIPNQSFAMRTALSAQH